MALSPPDAALEVLTAAASALTDPPAMRGVVLAAPAIDCDLLVVHLASLEMILPSEETPFASASMRPRVTMATLVATLAECVPVGARVKIEKTQAAALRIAGDATAIWFALARHDFDGCRAFSVGPALPLSEQGEYAGWIIPVRVQVEP